MPKLTFIEHTGREHVVEAAAGQSVMQAAIDHMVPGIIAECGGSCACATCHGYIEGAWSEKLPAMEEGENGMLDGSPYREASSRLTCQVTVTAELDGLVIRLPKSQY
ncbi:MAG TPA: 2Fe-2S iron-sulfur cluster-binding protein [Burkholderiales bacterium]|nr:2Fe-2S iron-sulfur cluster-binding protein [Burkholderiales bacterium]